MRSNLLPEGIGTTDLSRIAATQFYFWLFLAKSEYQILFCLAKIYLITYLLSIFLILNFLGEVIFLLFYVSYPSK